MPTSVQPYSLGNARSKALSVPRVVTSGDLAFLPLVLVPLPLKVDAILASAFAPGRHLGVHSLWLGAFVAHCLSTLGVFIVYSPLRGANT
jgi:hypothetical protein